MKHLGQITEEHIKEFKDRRTYLCKPDNPQVVWFSFENSEIIDISKAISEKYFVNSTIICIFARINHQRK